MLKNLFNLLIVAILTGLFLQYSCETKSSSEGDFEDIIVFSDSSLYPDIKAGLDNVFDNFVHTPQTERSFYHKWAPLKLLDSYKKRRNIILIGLLNQDDPVSEYVKKMLSPGIIQQVEDGEVFEIFQKDLFAYDQTGLILCAANKNQFLEKLSINAEYIFSRFEQYHFERLSKILFLGDEQYEIEDFLKKKYGWTIRVPYAFQLVKRSKDTNFVWIKRPDPSRSIFVFRTKFDGDEISEEWIRNTRDSLAAVYFEGDSVSAEDTYLMNTELNGIPAKKMVGIWQNSRLVLGGPFRTYVIHEQESGYVYFIDISVVAPGKMKKPFLDQLEVVARTFEFVSSERNE